MTVEYAVRARLGIQGEIHFWPLRTPFGSLLVWQIGPPESMLVFEIGRWCSFECHAWQAALALLIPPYVLLWFGFGRPGPSGEDWRAKPTNPAHALDGGIPALFHIEHHCPAASDVRR
jgi:hypothetical protein